MAACFYMVSTCTRLRALPPQASHRPPSFPMIMKFLLSPSRPWFLAIGLPTAFVVAWLAFGMSVWLAIAGVPALLLWLAALWCLGFAYTPR